jgi:hypothetical protein
MQPGADQIGGSARRAPRHLRRWLLAALLLAAVALRASAVFTVAINWDEFALLKAADITAESGTLEAAGHPGLAVILLLPFVGGCDDEVQVIRRARLLWLGISFAFLAGLAALLAQLQSDPRRRWGDAVLGVALLACVPAFLEWSIQVRSDQIALASGAWGGAALLASRRRPALALASGLLFGIGYLSSQKLFYVGALAAALTLGQLALARELRPRRESARALLCLAGFGLVFLAFRVAVASQFQVPEIHNSQQVLTRAYVSRGLSVFDFYRKTIGYSQYRAMLPSLVPHFLLLGCLAAASMTALRKRTAALGPLALAWAVLLLGAAVGWFHAGAFFYFWMTLGLFPAVAFAAAREPIAQLLQGAGARAARIALVGWCLLLALPALTQMLLMLRDTQSVQRETLTFVHRNFGSAVAGFHPESALFCRLGPQPIPTHFSETIYRRFAGAERERNSAQIIDTFRGQPIAFIVQSFRLNQFPVELRRFWAENYQPYRASVFVAGRRLEGAKGARSEFGLFVPGAYRWLPFTGPQPVRIDGRLLAAGEVASFEPGDYTAEFVEDVPGGMLVLALQDPPGPAPQEFYKHY